MNRPDRFEPARSLRYELVVTEGPDKGRSFVIDDSCPTRQLIGKGPTCELLLTDPSVSRRHAALELMADGLRITDLDSTNGTWVDRVKVVEADLQGDELVRIGSTVLRVDAQGVTEVPLAQATGFGALVGASVAMRRIYPLCDKLACSNVPVILEGETGTGKEVLAESLHVQGLRASGPFEVFDCTAVPPSLVESELFGHEKGAFTGAVTTRKGVFELAHGGTLLIDEIGDLDMTLQPKLLRALERLEFRRVGGDRWIKVDVRVLAATRRDLDKEVQAGRFRDDLLHRMAVARIELPALRNRTGDVELLARHFWREMGGDDRLLPNAVLQRWSDYDWPGNVRELRNSVARQLALGELAHLSGGATAEQPALSGADLVGQVLAMKLPFTEARDRLVQEFSKAYAENAIRANAGDIGRAAAASGVGRRYFQKLRGRP